MAEVRLDKALTSLRVYLQKPMRENTCKLKKLGKVRSYVFYPDDKHCVGIVVKRPDLAWMFHRKDFFVRIDACQLEGEKIIVQKTDDAFNKKACKRLHITLDDCLFEPAISPTVLKASLITDIVREQGKKLVDASLAKGGAATAVVAHKGSNIVDTATTKGAFAAGKQLGQARGMFSAFKQEYQKAARGDEE